MCLRLPLCDNLCTQLLVFFFPVFLFFLLLVAVSLVPCIGLWLESKGPVQATAMHDAFACIISVSYMSDLFFSISVSVNPNYGDEIPNELSSFYHMLTYIMKLLLSFAVYNDTTHCYA